MMRLFLILIFIFSILHAENLVRDFELYKLNDGDKRAPTLLLMGGIHGECTRRFSYSVQATCDSGSFSGPNRPGTVT